MCRFRVRFPDVQTASRGYAVLTVFPKGYTRHSELVLSVTGEQQCLLAKCRVAFFSMREPEKLIVEAPPHRYLSVLAELITSGSEILNQEELDRAVLCYKKPLHFQVKVINRTKLEEGLAGLRGEFEENFDIVEQVQ